MKALTPSDFGEFFRAVNGVPPFPWQRRLLEQVAERGWPALLDLPTGTGKTAAIDVAVFHLALEASRGTERRAPLRMLFVVDRRIIVDAAYDRAAKIAHALKTTSADHDREDVVHSVALALRQLAGPFADPLVAVRLRGGVPHDTDWTKSPSQPTVAVSTVDQVGSRLLFRGYGVSRRMWPVHAGLVGADALWLLDEVHLAKPLDDTLRAIEEGHEQGGLLATTPRPAPFISARLSATPGETANGEAFRLDSDDRKDNVLAKRLSAAKPATLLSYRGDPVAALVSQVAALLGGSRACRVVVVVNTVQLARDIFDRLDRLLADHAKCSLLIGRIREIDRDAVIHDLRDLLADPERGDPERPHVLVATQTVETGADFDVDALVTEIAPLDALRQRFGRLNRLGLRSDAVAVIAVPDRSEKDRWGTVEAVYGPPARETARWLQEIATKNVVDFGTDAMDVALAACDPQVLGRLLAPKLSAPTMLPSYVDDWATTSPPSLATPEPDLFLHGRRTLRDVQLVWRADVPTPRGHDELDEAESQMLATMLMAPPASPEVLEVPIYHAARLIERGYSGTGTRSGDGTGAEPLADVPVPAGEEESRSLTHAHARCWRYRYTRERSDRYQWVRVADVRPGDLLIIPSRYGGYDGHGWAADSTDEVRDHGAVANRRQRGRLALRVTAATLRNALLFEPSGPDQTAAERDRGASRLWERILERVTEAAGDAVRIVAALSALEGVPATWREILDLLSAASPRLVPFDESGDPAVGVGLVSNESRRAEPSSAAQPSVSGEDDSSNTGTLVTLEEHSRHVAAFARCFAVALGLEESLVDVVTTAALLHDAGKIDPRFQADLRGEAALYALGLAATDNAAPLAKSVRRFDPRGPRVTPQGFRHEAFSVALAKKHPTVAAMLPEHRDLALWLIGTHHGFGRPFFPPTFSGNGDTVTVSIDGTSMTAAPAEMPIAIDSGWLEIRSRVLQRWGAWETARFEAMVRLSDHAASAAEADGTIDDVLQERSRGV